MMGRDRPCQLAIKRRGSERVRTHASGEVAGQRGDYASHNCAASTSRRIDSAKRRSDGVAKSKKETNT